jgi:hypothetical protein
LRLLQLNLGIDIYNYSGIPPEALSRAELESDRIFRRAGVTALWRPCPVDAQQATWNNACDSPDAPTRLKLRLLPNSMLNHLRSGAGVCGTAFLPETGEFATMAEVYSDRVSKVAAGPDVGVILGRVMAHELGHLLLGHEEHPGAGVMRAHWLVRDLQSVLAGGVSFLPGEGKRIRAQILARRTNSDTVTVVDAVRFERLGE